jgi:FkbM family methyltransferase
MMILILARPNLQKIYERLFRILSGFLGYGNWSSDFRMTGERQILKTLSNFNIGKILDIGANEGQWSLLARNFLESEIIAFEPQKKAFEQLQKLNNQKITAINLAVGDVVGDGIINIHSSSSQLSFIDENLHNMPLLNGMSKLREPIQITSLDELLKTHPEIYSDVDFLKIDTEGYEQKVLLGGANFIKVIRPRFIQLEVNAHQIFTQTSIYSLSTQLHGYNLYKILPGGKNFYQVSATTPLSNYLQLSIFLFVRADVVIPE